MSDSLYTYILNIYDLVGLGWAGFYGITIMVGYLMPNPLIEGNYLINNWYSPKVSRQMLLLLLTFHKVTLYNGIFLIKWKFLASILFLWKIFRIIRRECTYLYIYKKYIWFGLVGFYGISNIKGYLMPNPCYTYKKNYIQELPQKKQFYFQKKFSSDDDPGLGMVSGLKHHCY